MPEELTDNDRRRIDGAIGRFVEDRRSFELAAESLVDCLVSDSELNEFIYFIKFRVKDPDSLRAKIERRIAARTPGFAVDAASIFERVKDLAGVRIIHLHTEQLNHAHPRILKVLENAQYEIAGPPTAYCWDVEYQQLFERVGIRTEQRQSMYTTVHYDVVANQETGIRCELQVRTLMDEVWAEVSHRVNYPTDSPSATCQDQLKVLARLTSGCGRLVDSIFKTHHQAVDRVSNVPGRN